MKNIPLQDVSHSAFPFIKLSVLYQVEFRKVSRENEILSKGFFSFFFIFETF